MAYGDWRVVSSVGGAGDSYLNDSSSGTNPGTYEGGPRLHSDLSNPLTGSGDFCREFRMKATSEQARSIFTITSSVSGGLFTEIPITKAVSVRASIRATEINASGEAIGIGIKMDTDGSTNSYTSAPRGYLLNIGSVTGTPSFGANLKLSLYDTPASGGLPAGALKLNILGGLTSDTWYHVRMDVTPVGTIQDRIEVYTGSEGGGTWDLVHTEIVLNSDTYYIPWGEPGAGEVGFFLTSTTTNRPWYIDNFEAYVVDV